MSEAAAIEKRHLKLHYRGRGGQILIYLGKLLRGFVYQNDWIVMPMAALIAGLLSMVVRKDFFVSMEGTLIGAFALTCVSIWNGCFNSIQVVCRERDILKREHRSGLHISAYLFSHMVYQALLCLGQTAITLAVCMETGVKFPKEGLFTPWLIVDLGITVFIITYASDMLSLWISCITTNTTMAMTAMPFILIFQLVFSGGIFALPQWANKISAFSISNYGLKCIAAQANYNNLTMDTGWKSIVKVENQELQATVTLGQVMDFLQRDDLSFVQNFRDQEYTLTEEQILKMFGIDPNSSVGETISVYEQLKTRPDEMLSAENKAQDTETSIADRNTLIIKPGQIIDELAQMTDEQGLRDKEHTFTVTVGQLLDVVGKDKAEDYIKHLSAKSNQNDFYENSAGNIAAYWIKLSAFIMGFAILSVVFLEFIDKDKR